MKETYITISDDTSFCNVGVSINEELEIIEINFIKNSRNWGILVVDPDGIIHNSIISNEKERIEISFDIESIKYSLIVRKHDKRYELYIEEI